MGTADPWVVFLASFILAALAGAASALRFAKVLSAGVLVVHALNAGMLGLGVGLLWFDTFKANGSVNQLVGFCVLVGLGGMTIVDFALYLFRQGGVTITIQKSEDKDVDSQN
jgi:hypothetical protein